MTREQTMTVVRWTARTLGTLVLGLLVVLAIGEGVPNPCTQPLSVNLLSLGLLTMVAGLLVAWRWEGIGGSLILGGLAFFVSVNHGIRPNAVFGTFFLVGVLYLLCWWKTPRAKP